MLLGVRKRPKTLRPLPLTERFFLVVDVDADVELVIVIGLMFAAPLLVGLELVDRAVDLAAVLAVFCGLAINFGAICLDTPMAVFFKIVVVVGKSHLGRREHKGHSQCQSQSDSSDFRFHGCSSYFAG